VAVAVSSFMRSYKGIKASASKNISDETNQHLYKTLCRLFFGSNDTNLMLYENVLCILLMFGNQIEHNSVELK
jgi:hypothetical protein